MNKLKSWLKLPFVVLFLSVALPLLFFSVYAQEVTNNMSISATIPAQASDFTATLASPSGTDFHNGDTITYNLSYSTDLSSTATITLQAEWYQGTITGNPSPTVDVVDYLPASATNGYNSTPPVIDTVNHTITWTIPNFSSSAGTQTVSFKLQTTSNYTGGSVVTFDVAGRLSALTVHTPDSKVTQNYTYLSPSATPTLTPTSVPVTSAPGPTSSPTPGSGGVTPTPTSAPISLAIGSVTVETILSTSASVVVTTNLPSQIAVLYGTSPSSLTKSLTIPGYALNHIVEFSGLTPNTPYFFTVKASTQSGSTSTSDIYSFKTAISSTPVSINLNTLVFTSENNILMSPEATSSSTRVRSIILPINTPYEFKFSLSDPSSIKKIRAFIRHKSQVLGANTFMQSVLADTPNTESVDLVETEPGIYRGRLKSNTIPGTYELVVQIQDTKGNLIEKTIADIIVTRPLTVIDAITKKPLEGVRLLLSVYNRSTKQFEQVSSSLLAVANPSFSDNDGEVHLVLPKGIYKVHITAFGYASKTVEFTISDTSSTQYPQVMLSPTPFNLINMIQFIWTSLIDFVLSLRIFFIDAFGSSYRVFNILTLLSILTFVGLTLVSFITRTHVKLSQLPSFIVASITGIFHKENVTHISGTVVTSDTKLPVSKATVYIMDETTHVIATTLQTNSQGIFEYTGRHNHYSVTIAKNGYEIAQAPLTGNTSIILEKKADVRRSIINTLWWIMELGLSFLFEFFLFASIVLEFFFLNNFPLIATAPIVLITILNCILWLLYIHRSVIKK